MNKDILRQAGFNEEIDAIEHGFCPICKEVISIDEFKDALSLKEYRISGLCQECQDKIFK